MRLVIIRFPIIYFYAIKQFNFHLYSENILVNICINKFIEPHPNVVLSQYLLCFNTLRIICDWINMLTHTNTQVDLFGNAAIQYDKNWSKRQRQQRQWLRKPPEFDCLFFGSASTNNQATKTHYYKDSPCLDWPR